MLFLFFLHTTRDEGVVVVVFSVCARGQTIIIMRILKVVGCLTKQIFYARG